MDLEYKGDYKLKLEKLKKLSLEPKPSFYKIPCPSCSENVLATNLNINDKIAKCDDCNVVFSFQETIKNLLTGKEEVKQKIIRPEGIDLFYFQDELDITIQQPYSILEGVVGGIGIPLALLFMVLAFLKPGLFPIIIAAFFSLISAYPIYSWINHSKQKIYISINDQFLNIEWRPKKGNKDKSYDRYDIDQFYVSRNPNTGYFEIRMVLNGLEGQKHVGLFPVMNLTKAKYLEQEIERHLGITNKKVLEEIG